MRGLLPAVVATLLLAACASGQAAPAARPTTSSDPATTASQPGVPAALDFTLPDLDGGQVDGASLAGGDVVLWFWAPW